MGVLGIRLTSCALRLMEHYDLRSCYLPDLAGLHLRIYQFQALLIRHLPELAAHLDALKVEPLYVSQWFLSFFAVTCPLPMLLRIYDVILSEGATETLMRVALSLMGRNQKKIMAYTEFEDVMQFLLSRGLWDTYAQHADDLVFDFVALTGLVTRESLRSLEFTFRDSQSSALLPSLKTAASQILGRFWVGPSHGFTKSGNNLAIALPSRPTSSIRKVASKQSLSSTVNSYESTSDASTLATETSLASRKSEGNSVEATSQIDRNTMNRQDHDLHNQIEDLLTALSDMQRQHAGVARDLQREREEREEDRIMGMALLKDLKNYAEVVRELTGNEEMDAEEEARADLIRSASVRFTVPHAKRESILQTKHQLRDSASEWKERHTLETMRCQDLMRQLDEREVEQTNLKEQLKDARGRIQDAYRDKQRLEWTIKDLRGRTSSLPGSPTDNYSPTADVSDPRVSLIRPGLREFKLGRLDAAKRRPTFSQRSSSLNIQTVLTTENHQPIEQDAILLELVNTKTAEAVARQELEEVKGKLEALRKMLGGGAVSPSARGTIEVSVAMSSPKSALPPTRITAESLKGTPAAAPGSTGGFFSGWGKRAS